MEHMLEAGMASDAESDAGWSLCERKTCTQRAMLGSWASDASGFSCGEADEDELFTKAKRAFVSKLPAALETLEKDPSATRVDQTRKFYYDLSCSCSRGVGESNDFELMHMQQESILCFLARPCLSHTKCDRQRMCSTAMARDGGGRFFGCFDWAESQAQGMPVGVEAKKMAQFTGKQATRILSNGHDVMPELVLKKSDEGGSDAEATDDTASSSSKKVTRADILKAVRGGKREEVLALTKRAKEQLDAADTAAGADADTI